MRASSIDAAKLGIFINESLRNQTLMNRASQQRDAVPNRLTVKVLAGYADPLVAGRKKDIDSM